MDVITGIETSFGSDAGRSPYLRQIVIGRLNDFFRLEELIDRLKSERTDTANALFMQMLDICERLHHESFYFSFYETYLTSKHNGFAHSELSCKRLLKLVDEERLNYLKSLPRCLSHFSQQGEAS